MKKENQEIKQEQRVKLEEKKIEDQTSLIYKMLKEVIFDFNECFRAFRTLITSLRISKDRLTLKLKGFMKIIVTLADK